MKQVLLFVAIITVCGSTMKAPIYRMCNTSISTKYYSKGKLVRVDEDDTYYINRLTNMQVGNAVVVCDSITITPKYTSYRMLD